MTTDIDWKPCRAEAFVWRVVGNEVYVLGDDGLTLRVFNGTGSALWSLCDGTRSIDELARTIVEQFEGISFEDALGDVREFLDGLAQTGMLR